MIIVYLDLLVTANPVAKCSWTHPGSPGYTMGLGPGNFNAQVTSSLPKDSRDNKKNAETVELFPESPYIYFKHVYLLAFFYLFLITISKGDSCAVIHF